MKPEDFEDFFREHYPSVLYWFRRQRLDLPTSEELTQDTMLSAFKGLQSFRGESSPKTWLLNIARNLFRNHLRNSKTQKRKARLVSLDAEPRNDGPELEVPDTAAPPLDEKLIEVEQKEALNGRLRELPPQMRQCLELRLKEMKYREIAVVMGLSVETVKSHLHQARGRLRECSRKDSQRHDPDEGDGHD